MEKGLISFKDLIAGDRLFRIPVYQRNYSWTDDQRQDLWEDLVYLEAGKRHYFGTTILRPLNESEQLGMRKFDVFEVIDGQQRVTTVLILLREILAQLRETAPPGDLESASQIQELEKAYLKYQSLYKLVLLGDDRDFFRDFIVDGKNFPAEITTPSRRRLKAARLFFQTRLAAERKKLPAEDFRQFCVTIKDRIEALELMTYPVDDVSDAVLIFETVNDRGKPLSNLEKTKSFLMHMVYLSSAEDPTPDLDKVNTQFGNVFRYQEQVSSSAWELGLSEDSIQRYHFVAFEPSAKGEKKYVADYLDIIKKSCRDEYRANRASALAYVRSYSEDLEKGFYSIREIARYEKDDEIRRALEHLFLLRRVANFYPLFVAVWPRLHDRSAELLQVLRSMETYVVRAYAVGNRRADTGIHELYSLAFEIHTGGLSLDDLVPRLVELTKEQASDETFGRNLDAVEFYSQVESQDIRYLLYEYEAELSRTAGEPLELKLEPVLSEDYTVEHIWAQNPGPLSDEERREHQDFSDRLGNLTLASRQWNSSWGNNPFKEKREAAWGYSNSSLRVQRILAESDALEWRKANIEKRGKELVAFCLKRWNLPAGQA